MNRFLLTLLMILISVSAASGAKRTFRIVKINTPSITINNRQLKTGATFSSTDAITWASDKQRVRVEDVETKAPYILSKAVFDSKGGIKNLEQYFMSTTKGSTRDANGNLNVKYSSAAASFPEKRLAVVIGNSNYQYMSSLRNAQTDATCISDALLNLGFDVIEAYETNYSDLITVLKRFEAMAPRYDVAMFYFAGHGVQDSGNNYLIPIDNRLDMKSDLDKALNCRDVMDFMERGGTKVNVMCLDACRDTKKSWSRSAEKGLAPMEGKRGSMIIYSTQSGETAADGEDDNSPFATAFLKNVGKAGVGVQQVMSDVANDTYRLTDEAQFPFIMGNIIGNFQLNSTSKDIAFGTGTVAKASKPAPSAKVTDHSAVSSASTAAATQATRRREPAKPGSIRFSTDDAEVIFGGAKLVGSKCYVDCYLVNRGRRDIVSSGPDVEAYDQNGKQYKLNQGNVEIVGPRYDRSCILPAGIPVRHRVILKDMPDGSISIPYMKMGYRGIDKTEYYGDANIEMKNIPVEGRLVSPRTDVSAPKMTFDVDGVTVEAGAPTVSNGRLKVPVRFVNNTSSVIKAGVMGKEPMGGYVNETTLVDTEGVCHPLGENLKIQNLTDGKLVLPPSVPVVVTATLDDYPEGDNVPYLSIAFRDMPSSESYGAACLRIYNLKIR